MRWLWRLRSNITIRWPRRLFLAGNHTLIEKPMAASVAECAE